MARPDLPDGFDGWQIIDATPQEESPQGGGYRTGPASLTAVKEGNSVVYDTNFVIAEVSVCFAPTCELPIPLFWIRFLVIQWLLHMPPPPPPPPPSLSLPPSLLPSILPHTNILIASSFTGECRHQEVHN